MPQSYTHSEREGGERERETDCVAFGFPLPLTGRRPFMGQPSSINVAAHPSHSRVQQSGQVPAPAEKSLSQMNSREQRGVSSGERERERERERESERERERARERETERQREGQRQRDVRGLV